MSGSRIERTLLAELQKGPGTLDDLSERAFGSHQAVRLILCRLRKEGVVVAEFGQRRGRGNPPLIYRLPT